MLEIKKASFFTTVAKPETCPNSFPEIAFAGRSNVGKSSLINALTNRKKLAQISKTPGKTRNLNYYLINDKLFFVDLPGYGYAKAAGAERERWSKLVDDYLNESPKLAGIVSLLDIRHEPAELDLQMADWVNQAGIAALFVLTKADKLSRSQQKVQHEKFTTLLPLSERGAMAIFSAVTREGKPEILKWIFETALPRTPKSRAGMR